MDEEKRVVPISAQTDNDEDIIIIDDGYKRIPIRNELGEQIGEFRFNPTDINIVNRYNEIAGKFEEVVKPLANAGIDGNGEGTDDESIMLLNEAEDRMIELMDYLLGSDSKDAFFKKVHAFSPSGGQFYCEKVFEAVGAYITKKFNKEIAATSARLEKHTHGYRTGKHKKGDR